MDSIPSWDDYFMNIAKAVATRSKDPRTKVGSIIVDAEKRIIATGYNGFPPSVFETNERWSSSEKAAFVVHAEASAIAYGGKDLRGAKLYCTLHPCPECAKLIIASGIKEVVYETHRDAYELAGLLFYEANVQVNQLQGSANV